MYIHYISSGYFETSDCFYKAMHVWDKMILTITYFMKAHFFLETHLIKELEGQLISHCQYDYVIYV